jgi:hypothetical protein
VLGALIPLPKLEKNRTANFCALPKVNVRSTLIPLPFGARCVIDDLPDIYECDGAATCLVTV